MLDFSSALYLGLGHPSPSLRPWASLTTGRPAALGVPKEAHETAAALAELVGCERATLAPSTLHLFWDLFGVLARRPVQIHVDAGVYAVGRWGVERAAARGAKVRTTRHFDAGALGESLARGAGGAMPVVITDGFCTDCGRPAPLAEYLGLARRYGGIVVVDDTQMLGVMGEDPSQAAPFGEGGGGSLRYHGIPWAQGVILASSLAKGFGAPIAALSGDRASVAGFEEASETRVYTSPPSAAVLRAAERALRENRSRGEALRRRLSENVLELRGLLRRYGLGAAGRPFPVQTITGIAGKVARTVYARLLDQGVRAVLTRGACSAGPRIVFVITALHVRSMIARAAAALCRATGGLGLFMDPRAECPA